MKFTFGTQPNSVKWFSTLAYILILLVWLQLMVETFINILFEQNPYPWREFIWDIFFACVLTSVLYYFREKFNAHIDDHIAEHKKLFKKNPHPMWIYDLKTLNFFAVNDAAISLYGFSESEFLAMKITDIRPYEDVPALISSTDNVKLNFNHEYHWSGTWRHKKKNGELIYVEVSSHEIIYDGKKGELVLCYDITDQVLQDQKLQALNQELERKVMTRTNDLLNLNRRLIDQNKVVKSSNLELFNLSNELQEANLKIQEHADLKNRFVSMASHEFRTPLANIAFSAGFLKHHISKLEPQNITAKLQGIETHVTHMAALLDDVLTIGKEDAVKLEVKKNSVNLVEFITKISGEVQTASNNSHKIHINMQEKVFPYLETDEKFLRNIFINLLSNAIKYSPGQSDVYLNVYNAGMEICFEISDKGEGIKKQDLEKIFEPFYRTDATNNIQGTGLGLSIVKRAVELLGARIQVQSEIGQGSKFTVILPLVNSSSN